MSFENKIEDVKDQMQMDIAGNNQSEDDSFCMQIINSCNSY